MAVIVVFHCFNYVFVFFRIQEERSERHKYKNVLRDKGIVGPEPPLDMIPDVGSYDTGDPNTTNLYLGNLNPKVLVITYLYRL